MKTWNAILVLLRARLLIARNAFWRSKLWEKLVVVLVLGFAGLLAFALYGMSLGMVAGLRSPEFAQMWREAAAQVPTMPADPAALLPVVPGFLLFVASLVLVISSFGSVLSSLYLSGDMDMLLTRPVPVRAVFVVKFFSGLMTQYGLLFVMLAPVLFGYGVGMGYGWPYLVTLVTVVLLLPLIPIGLGALLVMAVVRVIPAHRAREIVSVLGGLVAVGVYILSQFAPEIAPQLGDVRNVQTLMQLDMPVFPSAWAGRALTAAGEGLPLILLVYGGLFVLLSLLVFGGCLLLAERLYYIGWSNVVVQSGKVKRMSRQMTAAQPAEPAADGTVASLPGGPERAAPRRTLLLRPWHAVSGWWSTLEPQSAAVFFKDWRVFPRDMRNVQQLIFPLALAGIWVFRLLTLPPEPATIPDAQLSQEMASIPLPEAGDLLLLSSMGITFFLCYTFSSAIAGPGISREHRTLWLLKLAPISPLRILAGKLVLAYLPYLLVGTPILILLSVLGQASLTDFLTAWTLVLMLGLGTTSLSLGLGAAFPRVDWENPRQQTTLIAGCLSLLLGPLYIGVVLVAVFGFAMLAGLLSSFGWLYLTLRGVGWLIGLILTIGVMWASLSGGAWGLRRIDL